MAPDTMTVTYGQSASWQTTLTTDTTMDGTTHGYVSYYYGDSSSPADAAEAYERTKKLIRLALRAAWLEGRSLAGWAAPAPQRARAEAPPKARTEWGMVHRERCVHRMGLN